MKVLTVPVAKITCNMDPLGVEREATNYCARRIIDVLEIALVFFAAALHQILVKGKPSMERGASMWSQPHDPFKLIDSRVDERSKMLLLI